jgi:hypothetical protein
VQEPRIEQTGYWQVWMFVHPHCPCSRASLRQLRQLLEEWKASGLHRKVQATVWLVRPPDAAPGWEEGSLLREVRGWQETVIRIDIGAEQARRWGAARSGYTVVLDPCGRLRFRGGLTAGRLQEEPTPVLRLLRELVRGNGDTALPRAETPAKPSSTLEAPSAPWAAPVYGCPLCSLE